MRVLVNGFSARLGGSPSGRARLPRGRSVARPPITMMTLLIVLLLIALLGGGLGYGRFGAAGLGPAGVIILILVLLAVTGRL